MGLYLGATGLNEIDDLIASSIEDVSNILVDRIIIEDIHGSNYTDKVGIYGSNYTDKVGMYGSNYTDRQINDTSNYVKITSNILEASDYYGCLCWGEWYYSNYFDRYVRR